MLSSLWPFRRSGAVLPEDLARRVRRWHDLPEHDAGRPVASGRWVVVDVESGGLDAVNDALIAIGALAVNDGAIDLADSFEVVLRQASPSAADNIEVHGIMDLSSLKTGCCLSARPTMLSRRIPSPTPAPK